MYYAIRLTTRSKELHGYPKLLDYFAKMIGWQRPLDVAFVVDEKKAPDQTSGALGAILGDCVIKPTKASIAFRPCREKPFHHPW